MDNEQASFSVFSSSNLELLSNWLTQSHVQRWYPDPDSNLAWAASPPRDASQALIVIKNNPIGYIRWQRVSRETLDSVGLSEVPGNSADVDILIGEASHAAKGIGPLILSKLASRLRAQGDIPLI